MIRLNNIIILTLTLSLGACSGMRAKIGKSPVVNSEEPSDHDSETAPQISQEAEKPNDGSPEDGDAGDNSPPTQILPNYASLSKNIFIPKCVRCHASGGRRVPLDNYEVFLDSEEGLVDLDNPENSLVYQVIITENEDDIMPPTRTGLGPLSPDETKALLEWIRSSLPR